MNRRLTKPAGFAAMAVTTATILFATSAIASSLPATRSTSATHVNAALAAGGGEMVTVTTLDDVSDFSGAQKVSDLPGPDGLVSFREAVTAANNTAGPQTIAFAIPRSTFWLVPDVAMLRLEQGAFALNDSGTIVDFSTQATNIGNTSPSGPEVGIYGLEPNGAGSAAIYVNGDNCVIKGLGKVYQRGYAVRIAGNSNRVIGCQIDGPLHAAIAISGLGAPASGNVVGGTGSEDGNTLSGVVIDGPADGNFVTGNPLIVGVTVQGAAQFGVIASNNLIESNVISGAGHYGEEGFPTGAQVSVIDADSTLVEGNYIGTTADGMHGAFQIGPVGVEVRDSRGTTIRNNVIAGMRVAGFNHAAGLIFGQAIYVNAVNADTSGTLIQANTIGLAASGFTPVATYSGITVSPASGLHHVLGTLIASNHISYVETTGVVVSTAENGVTITANSIHDCGGLAIDLGADGATSNDPGDGDTGSNHLQNFPVLQSATTTSSGVILRGTLDSLPSAQFKVELFSSASCGSSGFGEGAAFIGSTIVTTDGSGRATFSLTSPVSVAIGSKATATATYLLSGDTSELSACIGVASASVPVAHASATQTSGNAPLTTQFSSTGSIDSNGTIASYLWNFGDGGNSTAANPNHTYTVAGTYTATLTVTNNSNISASATVTIIVNAAPILMRATAIDLSATLQGNDVTVTGSVGVRRADGAGVSGVIVSATWFRPGGAAVTLTATTNSSGIAIFSTTGGPGTYTLTIINATADGFAFDSNNSVLSNSITQSSGRRRSSRAS